MSAREWMRICFELLELLKAHKKSIRRAAINTFGYIAKVKLGFIVINMKIDLRHLSSARCTKLVELILFSFHPVKTFPLSSYLF